MALSKWLNKVICDAGPVIHLDELGCIDLLSEFQEINIPKAVYEEINRHRPSALHRAQLPISLKDEQSFIDPGLWVVCQTFMLDRGEVQALAQMQRNPDAIL